MHRSMIPLCNKHMSVTDAVSKLAKSTVVAIWQHSSETDTAIIGLKFQKPVLFIGSRNIPECISRRGS